MEFEIVIHEEQGYVEVVTEGVADHDGSLRMAKAIKEVMSKKRITKALVDHRNLGAVTGRILDIYNRPGILKLIGAIMRIKIAEVINPEHIEHFRFLETVSINQGYNVVLFDDREKALSWLLK